MSTLLPPHIPSPQRFRVNGCLWEGGELHLLNSSGQKRAVSHRDERRERIRRQTTCSGGDETFAVNCRAVRTAKEADGKICFPTADVFWLLNRAQAPEEEKDGHVLSGCSFRNILTKI